MPLDLTNVVAAAAGEHHDVLLRADGTVFCWGLNHAGQCDVPADLAGVVGVAAGSAHSLALKSDGRVVAWGANTRGQCAVPEGLSPALAIGAGSEQSYAWLADGKFAAWGRNEAGQCDVPAGLGNVVWVQGGREYGMALLAETAVAGPRMRIEAEGGTLRVRVEVAPGGRYCLEWAPDLGAPVWTFLEACEGFAGVWEWQDTASREGNRFFRVRREQ
jgi:hypothetical protein